jgi:hypothetical protein
MSAGFHEHELELELTGQHEHEHEHEHEQFFGAIANLAARAAQSPMLRRVAGQAARSALQGLLGEGELEGEGEFEASFGEGELNPIRKVYTDAMMEHMAHVASEAETEQEAAEALLPLIPMVASKLLPMVTRALPRAAARVAPKVLSQVMRVAPQLSRGVSRVTRTLHSNPRHRGLIRMMPTIARQTTAQIARHAAAGRPVTPRYALRSLAQQTARVLSNPRRCTHAWHKARRLDQRHHAMNPGTPCPGCARRRRQYGPYAPAYGNYPQYPGAVGPAAAPYYPSPQQPCVRCC